MGGQAGRIRTWDNSTLANITSFDKSSQKATSRYYFVVLVKQSFKTTNSFFWKSQNLRRLFKCHWEPKQCGSSVCDIKTVAPQDPELVFLQMFVRDCKINLFKIGPHTTSKKTEKRRCDNGYFSFMQHRAAYDSVRRLKSGNVQPLSRCLAKAAFCSGTLLCRHTRRAVSNKEKPILKLKKETAVRSSNDISFFFCYRNSCTRSRSSFLCNLHDLWYRLIRA